MSTKKSYDGKYVSRELGEINHISKKYVAPQPLLFHIQNEMSSLNKGKVLRTKFYEVLELIGYTR